MEDNYYDGSAETLETVKSYIRDYSMWIFGLLVVLIIYLIYCKMMRKEGMYNPGATAWLELGNWKENMIDASKVNCAEVSMSGFDEPDPYRYYVDNGGMAEAFTDAQLSTQLFK